MGPLGPSCSPPARPRAILPPSAGAAKGPAPFPVLTPPTPGGVCAASGRLSGGTDWCHTRGFDDASGAPPRGPRGRTGPHGRLGLVRADGLPREHSATASALWTHMAQWPRAWATLAAGAHYRGGDQPVLLSSRDDLAALPPILVAGALREVERQLLTHFIVIACVLGDHRFADLPGEDSLERCCYVPISPSRRPFSASTARWTPSPSLKGAPRHMF